MVKINGSTASQNSSVVDTNASSVRVCFIRVDSIILVTKSVHQGLALEALFRHYEVVTPRHYQADTPTGQRLRPMELIY